MSMTGDLEQVLDDILENIGLHDELLTECIAALAIVEKRLRNDTVKLEPREYQMLAVRLHEVQKDLETLKMSK